MPKKQTEKMVAKIRCTLIYELNLDEELNQEGADLIEIDDVLRDGELEEQWFEYYDKKEKKINPR